MAFITLVTADAALEFVGLLLFVGNNAVVGMTSLGWLGLNHERNALAELPRWRYSNLMS
jgi:hypothetical protein